jgi:Septum formation
MRCLECGAESAERSEVCARCGAPIAHQVPVGGGPAQGGSGDPIAPKEGNASHQPTGQRPEPSGRRNAVILAGLGLVLLVAVTVLVLVVTTIIARSISSTSSRSTSSPSKSATSLGFPSAYDGLQAGYCLVGSDLGLGTGDPLPDVFTVVPCTQQHIAEVFFADNLWPSSPAYRYPGDSRVLSQAEARCDSAFRAYDGTYSSLSSFSYDYSNPDSTTWSGGDRLVVCIAYESTGQYPGGAPVDYSIKGSQQ